MPDNQPPPGAPDPGAAGGSSGSTPPVEKTPEWKAPVDALSKGLQEMTEGLKNLSALVEAGLTKPPAGGGGDPDPYRPQPSELKLTRKFSEKYGISDEAVSEIIQETASHLLPEMERRMVNTTVVLADREKQKVGFYKKNPDLQGYEIEVGHFSNEVSQEAVSKRWSLDKQFEETAKRAREYVSKRTAGQGGGQPPHVLDPNASRDGGGGGGGVEPSPEDSLDPTRAIDEDIRSRNVPVSAKRY